MEWIDKYRNFIIFLLSFAFLAMNIALIVMDFYWLLFLPLTICVLLLYFVSLDHILLLISFLTPLSVGVSLGGGNFGLSIPSEPLLVGVCIIFVLRLIFYSDFEIKLLKHPLSIFLIGYLLWMFIASLFSEMPLVSFKYLISRIWFIIPLYFVAFQVFKNKKNFRRFSTLYILSLLIVIVITLVKHSNYGFSEEAGHWVMSPFYNDHTAYGTMLAFFIPVLIGFYRFKSYSLLFRNRCIIFFCFSI